MTTPRAKFDPQNLQKIMLLGSGELGRELTISFQRLGKTVVACDTYSQAPAMQVSEQASVFDLSDPAALRAQIQAHRPDLIVSEVEKLAVEVLQEVGAAEDEFAPQIATSASTIAATFNRQEIRVLADQTAQVPTSPYRFAHDPAGLKQAALDLGLPCFIKPVMSSSGHGQSYVTQEADLDSAWERAIQGARGQSQSVIVEGAVPFDYEITLLTVCSLSESGTPQITFCAPIGHRQVAGDYVESWQPQMMSATALQNAQEVARRVVLSLAELEPERPLLGLFGVELFMVGDQAIFSELAPRPHDTGMVTSITQRQSEFDLFARAVLGLPTDTALLTAGASAVVKAEQESTRPRISGLSQALTQAEDVRIFTKPQAYPGRRMGVVLASSPQVEVAREKAQRAAACLKVH